MGNITAPSVIKTTSERGRYQSQSFSRLLIYVAIKLFSDVLNAISLWRGKLSRHLETLFTRNALLVLGEITQQIIDNRYINIYRTNLGYGSKVPFHFSCKNPFPTGERVTFTGKSCLCQKCIQAEKNVDLRLQQVRPHTPAFVFINRINSEYQSFKRRFSKISQSQ